MDFITPEELEQEEEIRRMAGGDAADPVRQYLEARAGRHNKLAVDGALAGGIKTVGGLGLMGFAGPPGMVGGGVVGLNGLADLLFAFSKRHRGRRTQEAADAFGNTGLPGRPSEDPENPLLHYMDSQ
jgi:hypothetical protein